MPQYNRNDLEIAARNQHFTRDTDYDPTVWNIHLKLFSVSCELRHIRLAVP